MIAQLVERQVGDQKVADPEFDYPTGNLLLRLGKDLLVYSSAVVAQPNHDL